MTSYIISFYKSLTIILSVTAFGLLLSYFFYSNGHFIISAVFLAFALIAEFILVLNLHLWLNNKVFIRVSDDGFTFEIEKKDLLVKKEYPFSEIKAYQFEFSGKEKNGLIFRFYKKDDKFDKYIFITKKDDETQIEIKPLAKSLHLSIQKYNTDKAEDQKIAFRPSFSASRTGIYTIVFLGVAYLMLVIVMIILSSKGYSMNRSFLVYIVGMIPFFRLLLARRSALNFRKEMMKIADKELK